jgi:hypothetical protein
MYIHISVYQYIYQSIYPSASWPALTARSPCGKSYLSCCNLRIKVKVEVDSLKKYYYYNYQMLLLLKLYVNVAASTFVAVAAATATAVATNNTATAAAITQHLFTEAPQCPVHPPRLDAHMFCVLSAWIFAPRRELMLSA